MTMTLPLAFGGMGAGELVLIFLIVLLVFGAKRLPDLARALGQAKREFHKATKEVSDEVAQVKTGEEAKVKINGV